MKAKNLLQESMVRAGLSLSQERITKNVFNAAIGLNLLISAYLVYLFGIQNDFGVAYVLVTLAVLWFLVFFAILFVTWFLFYMSLDLLAYRRKLNIEDVLPDFLQLTAANLRAGMPLDSALWYAVRPRFGVLLKEIEIVAKETISGRPLPDALQEFGNKYDSLLLRRSVNLLIEGMQSGGELGEILNKIANNIEDTRLLQKEMSANVTTYVIFISSAVLFAAPVLLALSSQLLSVVSQISSQVSVPASVAAQGLFTFSKASLAKGDFDLFALIILVSTSFFSAMLIAIIQKGEVKAGIKFIPLFLFVSLVMFWLAGLVLSSVIGGFFTG